MKIRTLTLVTLAAATLAGGSAFADFVAGRVRPGYRSEMTVAKSTGIIFQGVTRADATLNYEDGKREPVSITVSIPNWKQAVTLPIHNIKKTGCGDHYSAYNLTMHRGPGSAIELTDYTNAKCERVIRYTWELKYSTADANDALAVLELEGNSEPVFVTM